MADPTGGGGGSGTPEKDIAKLAGYGPPPGNFLGAPVYALKVRKRQKVLADQIASINQRMKGAESERDGAEAQLGQAAVDFGIITGQEADELKSKVAEAERSIDGAKQRKSQADEVFEKEMERLKGALEGLDAQMAPLLERQQSIDREVKAAEAAHGRAEALARRTEIELRNVEQAATKGAVDPAQAAARKSELESHKGAAEAELRTRAAAVGRAKAEAGQLGVQLNPLKKKHGALTAERDELVKENEERLGAHTEHQKLASNWRRSRLAVIGRQIYAMDPRPKLMDAERLWGRIDQSRRKVESVQKELEPYLKAMDAYEPEVLDQAKYVLMAGGGVLAVLLLAALLYAC